MKVMIVDDEPAMLAILERCLGAIEGVAVAGAFRTATEAVAFAQTEAADIAIVDIMIGQDNGLELARQLRAARPELELIFVTSHRDYALPAFEAYPLDYIVKPISPERLAQTIERARGRRKPGAERSSAETPPSDRLRVQGLGGFETTGPDGAELKWMSRKSQELFAYLLLQRGRYVSKSRVLEDIFADMSIKNAEGYLYTAVYQLRKALQPYGMKAIVLAANEQYALQMERIEADFVDFEAFVSRLALVSEDTAAEALAWEQRYGGELYEGRSYMWSVPERERLGLLYSDLAKRLAEWLLARDRHVPAMMIATRLLAQSELDEEANALLLQAYRGKNDRVAYEKHYARFEALYRQEFGAPPPDLAHRYAPGFISWAEG